MWKAVARSRAPLAVELLVVTVWTLLITRPYLDLDPAAIPTGSDYVTHILPNHVWT